MKNKEQQKPKIISNQEHYMETVRKAMEKAKVLGLECIVPIVDLSDEYDLHVIGSSLFLKYNGRAYLATASHVIPEHESKNFHIPCKGKYLPLGGFTMRMRSSEGDDRHDLLLFAPHDELAEGLSFYTGLIVNDSDKQRTFCIDENVAIMGYPTSRNRKHRRRIPKFYIQGLMERIAPLEAYTNEKYSADLNILINFSRESCYTQYIEKTTHPDPHGMSGGGVWRLFGPTDRNSPTKPYLIGIVMEKTHTERYIVAVKIGYVIDVLRELEKHVQKNTRN